MVSSTSLDTRNISELIRDFHANTGLKIIAPKIKAYILAENHRGMPLVSATLLKEGKWSVGISEMSYMFQDNGFFGYTDDKSDKLANAFNTIEEAIECFHKFHNPAAMTMGV